ncbi:MAG: polyprenol monophosphomannose synthase [Planctomycetota bacterium]|nr:MAG: polyprenol monophosphomannose synthase [Planctomycetota bacterium]
MTTDPQTLVTVATYNEIENLPRLVDTIFDAAPEVHILVIDDNSPDGTGRWVDQRAAEEPRLKCLHREGKLGLGTATLAGMRYGIEHGYRYVLNLDADFSHPPEKIPELIAAMDPEDGPPADVAVGSRYVPGGKIEGWPPHRRLMSWGVNTYARLLLGLPVRDCSGAFRCYRASTLARVDFRLVRSRGYSFQEEILYWLRCVGARMVEVPITFVDRRFGKSKINWKEAVAALGILAWIGLRRPFCRPYAPTERRKAG